MTFDGKVKVGEGIFGTKGERKLGITKHCMTLSVEERGRRSIKIMVVMPIRGMGLEEPSVELKMVFVDMVIKGEMIRVMTMVGV